VTGLEAALRQIAAALAQANAAVALVGGLAVSVRTEPRFTRDADFAVAVASDAEAEALIKELRFSGYGVETVVEQAALARLATVRLSRSKNDPAPLVDLLFASSGIEPEVVAEAEPIELLHGFRMNVASVGHLLALKILSRDDVTRPQDIADLRALQRVASPAEVQRARDSVALITARGYHRGRALTNELETLFRSNP
jgi:hypothetical protein